MNRWIVNSAFKLQPRHAYPKVWFYFQKGGNKMKKNEKCCSSELKHLFTIHLFTFFFLVSVFESRECIVWRQTNPRSNHWRTKESSKWWTDQIHFMNHLVDIRKGGNKMKKWETFSCSELKHLFTYSPIHSLQLQIFGIRVEIKRKNGKHFLGPS